jgi:F420-non-reducing hydrogenase small subunit
MAEKLSVATAWLQGCSGCHMAFLDIHQGLMGLLDWLDIRYSPPLMDTKEPPEVTLALVEGAVANEENETTLIRLRQKSKILVALGTCACAGGITGMRNLATREEVLACGYIHTPTTVNGKIPAGPPLPELTESVKAVDQVVKVDHYIPGCPPLPSRIEAALVALAQGKAPEKKTRNLCEQCHRTKEKMLQARRDYLMDEVVAVNELDTIDPERCFLEQGVLCMGPATSEGCGALCPKANMPCRGCQGPPSGTFEQGAKLINCLSSILPAGGLMFNEDIVGVGYCYSMAVSTLSGGCVPKGGGSHE